MSVKGSQNFSTKGYFLVKNIHFLRTVYFYLLLKNVAFPKNLGKNYKTSEKNELFFIQIFPKSKLENWGNTKEKEQRIGSGGGIRKRCLKFHNFYTEHISVFVLLFLDIFSFYSYLESSIAKIIDHLYCINIHHSLFWQNTDKSCLLKKYININKSIMSSLKTFIICTFVSLKDEYDSWEKKKILLIMV